MFYVFFLLELKGSEFPAAVFEELGYHSAAVTQKTYNGVAILSRTPVEIISKTLLGGELDSHARFLEVMIVGLRLVNIYLPNGNPIGTEKFAYKLAWMDRLALQMQAWLESGVPTIVGGDFNVIPEDMDCHKPASWIHDALFQPEPRARYRAMLSMGYVDAFRSLHPGEGGQYTFWDYFRRAFEYNRGYLYRSLSACGGWCSTGSEVQHRKGPRSRRKTVGSRARRCRDCLNRDIH